jgi:hypothetical protein
VGAGVAAADVAGAVGAVGAAAGLRDVSTGADGEADSLAQ